jgi:hypothetical protein
VPSTAPITVPSFDETSEFARSVAVVDTRTPFPKINAVRDQLSKPGSFPGKIGKLRNILHLKKLYMYLYFFIRGEHRRCVFPRDGGGRRHPTQSCGVPQ